MQHVELPTNIVLLFYVTESFFVRTFEVMYLATLRLLS